MAASHPGVPIDEDPVTGSVHAVLAPLLGGEIAKAQMTAYQASARGGNVIVNVGDSKVLISGDTTTALQGQISIHRKTLQMRIDIPAIIPLFPHPTQANHDNFLKGLGRLAFIPKNGRRKLILLMTS